MPNAYEWDQHGYAKSPFWLPTERATTVLFEAAALALRSNDSAVEPEYLLFALASLPESMAARVLAQLGISLDSIRSAVAAQIASRSGTPEQKKLLLSPAAKQAVDFAYDEARQLDNLFIGVEHLLLGLLRLQDGIAPHVLADLGVELEQVRQETHRMKWG